LFLWATLNGVDHFFLERTGMCDGGNGTDENTQKEDSAARAP
jgi:hypothetical protein